jgi:hypothetical protein
MAVLQQIFKCINPSIWTATALKVSHKQPQVQGLYLAFPHDSKYGFVYRGKNIKGADMEFDVYPAETRPAWKPSHDPPRYAFRLHRKSSTAPVWDNWLLWDINTGSIRLTDDIQPSCFVCIQTEIKDRPWEKFSLTFISSKWGDEPKKLKWGAQRVQPEDLELDIPLRTADISYTEEGQEETKVQSTEEVT